MAVSKQNLSAFLGIIFVIAVIVFGVYNVDTPRIARQKKFDDLRSNALLNYKNSIDDMAFTYGRIPTSTEEMKSLYQFDYIFSQRDPETGELYEYIPSTSTYALCANFSRSTQEEIKDKTYYPDIVLFRKHDAGRSCFTFDIPNQNPSLVPKNIPVFP